MATLTICRKGFIPLIALVFLFIMANLAFAETKVFVEEYTYQASEADSKLSSRVIAFEQVKRLLLERLGTYLESETEIKSFRLSKDQIVILTAGVVSAEIMHEKWDGKTYYLKAKISADPKDVATSIEKLRQDRQKTNELEEMRKKADQALKEVEKLKREREIAKAGKTEQEQYKAAVNRLSATDWFNRGLSSGISGKHQEAMEAFNKVIDLDPNYAGAYVGRGTVYQILGDNQQAIRDFGRAIELNSKYAQAYFRRGFVHVYLSDHWQAIKDLDRGIELDPQIADAYLMRGIAYSSLGDYRQAIGDLDRAIELEPKSKLAYFSRGHAYGKLGDYQREIRDYDRVIELDPKNVGAYLNRGNVCGKVGNDEQAIRDYNRVIELDHGSGVAYFNRGLIYLKFGPDWVWRALGDFRTAARLDYKPAQDFLRSRNLKW